MQPSRKPSLSNTWSLLIGIIAIPFAALTVGALKDQPVPWIASARAHVTSAKPAQTPPAQTPPGQPSTPQVPTAQTPPPDQSRPAGMPALMVAGKFTGANEPEGIKLVSETSAFKHQLQIAAISNKEVKNLRVEVAPFNGPNSVQSNIVWTVNGQAGDKPVTVPGLASIPLELTGDLPIAGNYESTIWLIYDDKRWPIKLTVSRTRIAPTVEVLGVATARNSTFLWYGNASLLLTLHETAGKKVTLNMPALTSLELVQSDKSKLQAQYEGVEVKCLGQDCKKENALLELGPGQTLQLQLTIVNLQEPGEFSGNLRVSGTDGTPIDRAITILRKKSPWFAALLIALGVGISFALRHYASSVRPRLVRQREALGQKEDIEELQRTYKKLNAEEKDVLDYLHRQARDLVEDIATARQVNAEQVIKDIKAKVELFPRWLQERGRVDGLMPRELQKDFRTILDKVKNFMYASPITDQSLKEHRDLLDNIAPQMKAKVKEDLKNKTAAFKDEVNTHRNSTTSAEVKQKITDEVEPQIKEVAEHLKSDDKLKEAGDAYTQARLAYVRILCQELESSFPAAAPLGFDDPGWTKLKGEVNSLLQAARKSDDPDSATATYLQAYSIYLRGLTWKLQEQVNVKKEFVEKSSIAPADKVKFKEQLDGVATSLAQALTRIDSGDMRAAAGDYEAATKSFVAVVKQIGGGTLAAAAGPGAPAEATPPPTIPGAFSLPFLSAFADRKKTPTIVGVTKKLGWLDLVFTGVILLIAVLLGLKLLWVGNLTWGGWDAYLTAVLWGLGLHQVSGVAFEGIQGLTAKFGSGQ